MHPLGGCVTGGERVFTRDEWRPLLAQSSPTGEPPSARSAHDAAHVLRVEPRQFLCAGGAESEPSSATKHGRDAPVAQSSRQLFAAVRRA